MAVGSGCRWVLLARLDIGSVVSAPQLDELGSGAEPAPYPRGVSNLMTGAGVVGKEEATQAGPALQADHEAPAGIQPGAYIPELESLRGLAILLVVSYHISLLEIGTKVVPASIPYPRSFVRAGHTGVSLFFVLSALLLSQPFITGARGGRRVVRRRYFARRALRTCPSTIQRWCCIRVSSE